MFRRGTETCCGVGVVTRCAKRMNAKFRWMKIYSISESSGSPAIQGLRELLEEEWGPFSAFETTASGIRTPPALVALEHEMLAGGLVYSLWPDPETERMAIWINGLIVKPEFRHQGIATRLIESAMADQSLLFVLTHLPNLYRNVGWEPLSESEKGTVLKYQSE